MGFVCNKDRDFLFMELVSLPKREQDSTYNCKNDDFGKENSVDILLYTLGIQFSVSKYLR